MSQIPMQRDSWLSLETPLGADAFIVTEIDGEESLSSPFRFVISVVTPIKELDPDDLLGKSATLTIARPDDERRIINGIVAGMSARNLTERDHGAFSLTLVPSLWLLSRSSNYRVFQEKSAIEIVRVILKEWNVRFEEKLQERYDKRDYCIQFGETDLEFVQRLLAEEGLLYYFTHETGRHTMVIGDDANAYADCERDTAIYRPDDERSFNTITELDFATSLTDAEWSLRDYDFEAPQSPIDGKQKTRLGPMATKQWGHFAYPAGATKTTSLSRLANAQIDRAEANHETGQGRSGCVAFAPGHRFKLSGHPVKKFDGSAQTITHIRHRALDRSYFAVPHQEEIESFYNNTFSCIPAERIARPEPLAKPIVAGPQTAVVVGPKGQEVHSDKYGRVRVQFHWDRNGNKDETSSCFLRVAQPLAGDKWGTLFVPRIGMEVVVQFLDGNPDRPLITGAVYNGDNLPPWVLSDSTVKSGILTRSTKAGTAANANELSFEDKKGAEKILIHAERDFVREVENDDSLEVGGKQSRTITGDRSITIAEGNESVTLTKGDRSATLEKGDETLEVKEGDRTVTVAKGDETLEVKKGTRQVTLGCGDDSLTLDKGDHATTAKSGKITLDARCGIILKCGCNKIEVTPQGIKINGITISMKGEAKADLKAPMLNVSGDGMLNAKGGLVKIN